MIRPLALALFLTLAGAAAAQEGRAAGAATPRELVAGFLAAHRQGDHARAAEFLEPGAARSAAAARHLGLLLEQQLMVDPAELSDAAEGSSSDGLPPDFERLGTVDTPAGTIELRLRRLAAAGLAPRWLFSDRSLRRLALAAEQVAPGFLHRLLPGFLFELRWAGLTLGHLIGVTAALLLAALLAWLAAPLVLRALRSLGARTRTALDDQLVAVLRGPLRLGLAAVFLRLACSGLDLPSVLRAHVSFVVRSLAVLAATWFALRALEVLAGAAQAALVAHGNPLATSLVPLGKRTLQVFAGLLGLLFLLQNLGLNVTGLLAGLGVGGLAVALAAQKTLENFFGGVTLVLDRPLRVGESCTAGGSNGVVEHIGLRSTRLRTAERSLLTVPNGVLAALPIENLSARDRRLVTSRLALEPGTSSERLKAIVAEARTVLGALPGVLDEPRRLHIVGFQPGWIELELQLYLQPADEAEFFARREELLLAVLGVIERAGVKLAEPPRRPPRDGG